MQCPHNCLTFSVTVIFLVIRRFRFQVGPICFLQNNAFHPRARHQQHHLALTPNFVLQVGGCLLVALKRKEGNLPLVLQVTFGFWSLSPFRKKFKFIPLMDSHQSTRSTLNALPSSAGGLEGREAVARERAPNFTSSLYLSHDSQASFPSVER